VAPDDPLLQVRQLRADRRRVAVARADRGVAGQREQAGADRVDDRVERRERPARRAGTALEQGVAGEDRAQLRDVQAGRAGGVPGRGDRLPHLPATSPACTARPGALGHGSYGRIFTLSL